MNVHVIVRASFDKERGSKDQPQNDVRIALTGTLDRDAGHPFDRLGTGFYSAADKDASEVAAALAEFVKVLAKHSETIDHFFVSAVTGK